MATSYAPVLLQLFDDYGDVLAGGKVYTYEAGTSTPLATYQDLAGATPNANPVILDAAGRATIRLTDGVAYKYIVHDSDDNLIATQDNVVVGEAEDETENVYLVHLTYCETPGAQAFMGGAAITHACVFPVDFDGSAGSVGTLPGGDYTISVQKNGIEVGTILFDALGEATFATTGGGTVSCIFGDVITFVAPDSGSAGNIMATLVGELA
jgi:hypothetical protein